MVKPIIVRSRQEEYKQPHKLERLPLVDHEVGTVSLTNPIGNRLTVYRGILSGRTLTVGNANSPYLPVYDFPSEPINFTFSLDDHMDYIIAYTMLESNEQKVYIWYNDVLLPLDGIRNPYLTYCGRDVFFGYIRNDTDVLEIKGLKDGFTNVIYSELLTDKHELVRFGLTKERRIQCQLKLFK